MSSVRKNTLVVDFSVLPVRPDVGKVHQFLENEIGLNLADVKSIQLHNTRNCVFIEMIDIATAQRYQKAHNIKRVFVCQEKQFKIPVYVDSEAVTVRVHDLPPSTPHATVGEFMKKFGDAISIRSEKWKHYFPGVPNGVRVLQMRLKGPIPSYITIENNVCLVTHPNQPKTCRWCCRPAHPNQKCAKPVAETVEPPSTASTTSASNAKMFSDAEFPPMTIKQPSSSSSGTRPVAGASVPTDGQSEAVHNTDNDDDKESTISISSSASDSELVEATNKRRLLKQKENEKKKVCPEQCAQTIGHTDSGK